ncbi:MAG: plastocyanin/azurin family copper-binding protein [Candidatus Spechtbacterales bacterium]
MKKIILGAVIIAVSVALGLFLTSGEKSATTNTTDEKEQTGEVHEFVIYGGNYYYTVEEIRVKKGDTVKITFSSEEGFHDFVLDEFNVATQRYRPGEGEETVEFVADQAGEFEYYCSVGEHRQLGQVGTLIVEE